MNCVCWKSPPVVLPRHHHVWQFAVAFMCLSVFSMAAETVDKTQECNLKGHLKPFGQSGDPSLKIEVRNEFPKPQDFLEYYISKSKPVKLSGVMQDTRAVRLWTDDYLLSLDIPEDSTVHLETRKKENRSQEVDAMHFHDFLKIYNKTEHYMVDDVPAALRPDIAIPCSLQCPELVKQGFAFALMWFSSGGTNSVVHTDAFDNINCLLRGQKSFVMMDPARDRNKIDIGHNGAFSSVDVDSVDLVKYAALAEAEFYHVNMTAGDCLYIPYRWIHQVRSYGSNIAVNFWWDHYASMHLLDRNDQACQAHCDPDLSLDKVQLHGQESTMSEEESLKDWLKDIVENQPIPYEMLLEMLMADFGDPADFTFDSAFSEVELEIRQVFEMLDKDKDGQYTVADAHSLSDQDWSNIREIMNALTTMADEEQLIKDRAEYAKHVEADRREEL